VRAAVERARAASWLWRRLRLAERARALRAAAKDMVARRNEITALVEAETGKTPVETLLGEALGPLDQVNQWTRLFRAHARRRRARVPRLAFPGKRAWVDLVPRGVVGAITPWNFPLGVFFRPVIPALLAGNGVVVKPSEHALASARWFAEALAPHLPPGLFALVPGDGRHGRALVESGIDACVFTGSVAVGRDVARRCAERGIPLSAELGGLDAAIVLADCDVDRTLAGVSHWALHNAGQNCGAIKRLFVEEAVAGKLVPRLAACWRRLRVGPGPASEVDVSPLATDSQLERVERHVADARARGAVLLCGGRRTGSGRGYEPTLLDRCTDDMAVMAEETFGPVLPVARVADAEEAVRRANASAYGLGGSVWTRDVARGRALAERLECGVVAVNNHAISGALVDVPWTGIRHSGPGIANSAHALLTFLRPRTVLVDRSRRPDVFWIPHDADLLALGDDLGHVQTGSAGRVFGLLKRAGRRLRTLRAFWAEGAGGGAAPGTDDPASPTCPHLPAGTSGARSAATAPGAGRAGRGSSPA
jgi:acyl-CoA reductase-like NAD-dependent aldehyde dehydrogenase